MYRFMEMVHHCCGGLKDLREEGGVVRGREVHVSLQQWLIQRVAHIHRAGPGNQPGIVLALLYRMDVARVRELTLGGRARLAAGTGGKEETWLREHPGTKAYLGDFRQDLLAMARWRHPPSLFLTFSTNVGTPDFLGAWVSHVAGVASEEVQVWAAVDETERLGGGGGEEGEYFVHERCEEQQGTCTLHPHCSRTPLEASRDRFVSYPLKCSQLICCPLKSPPLQVQQHLGGPLLPPHDVPHLQPQGGGPLHYHPLLLLHRARVHR